MKNIVNISDKLVAARVLPHIYIFITPGIMDILVKFEGDVKYAKQYLPEVQGNIPDYLRSSVCSKSESTANSLIR